FETESSPIPSRQFETEYSLTLLRPSQRLTETVSNPSLSRLDWIREGMEKDFAMEPYSTNERVFHLVKEGKEILFIFMKL
ncbi:hypothetical protein CR513_42397, partial [Mucuna pruriens]